MALLNKNQMNCSGFICSVIIIRWLVLVLLLKKPNRTGFCPFYLFCSGFASQPCNLPGISAVKMLQSTTHQIVLLRNFLINVFYEFQVLTGLEPWTLDRSHGHVTNWATRIVYRSCTTWCILNISCWLQIQEGIKLICTLYNHNQIYPHFWAPRNTSIQLSLTSGWSNKLASHICPKLASLLLSQPPFLLVMEMKSFYTRFKISGWNYLCFDIMFINSWILSNLEIFSPPLPPLSLPPVRHIWNL